MKLPDDFVRYLRSGASRSGERLDFPLWFEIWPEDQMDLWNREYQVDKYAPEFYGFAGDGGGEIFVFDSDGAVYELPLIGMEPKAAKLLAASWAEFESQIVKPD